MAKVVGFSPDDAKRIADAVREMERRLRQIEMQRPAPRPPEARIAIDGVLRTTLVRNGHGQLGVYAPDGDGGRGDSTAEEYTVVDTGKIPDGTTLPIGCAASAVWCNGEWLLVSYDCDMEEITEA